MAKHIFQGPIDLNNYELLNGKLQNLFEFPDNPGPGQVIFRSDLEVGALYTGVQWIYFGTPGGTYTDLSAVHYDRDDAKGDGEQAQARSNISVYSVGEVHGITGFLENLTSVERSNLVAAINSKNIYREIAW